MLRLPGIVGSGFLGTLFLASVLLVILQDKPSRDDNRSLRMGTFCVPALSVSFYSEMDQRNPSVLDPYFELQRVEKLDIVHAY